MATTEEATEEDKEDKGTSRSVRSAAYWPYPSCRSWRCGKQPKSVRALPCPERDGSGSLLLPPRQLFSELPAR